jgi:hypothetical protein
MEEGIEWIEKVFQLEQEKYFFKNFAFLRLSEKLKIHKQSDQKNHTNRNS